MWWLSFIPDAILQQAILILIFIGVSLYPVAFFATVVPGGKRYKPFIFAVATIITILGFYFEGSYSTEMAWRQRVEEVKAKVAQAEEASKEANTKLEKARKQKQQVRVQYYSTVKERIVEKKVLIDAKCELDPAVAKIHNDAASNPAKGSVTVEDVKK